VETRVKDQEIVDVLSSFPDKTAEALAKWKTSKLKKDMVASRLYLEFKAKSVGGEKISVKELEAMVQSDDSHYKACLEEIMAESDHIRCYEKLLAAKKMAGIRAGF